MLKIAILLSVVAQLLFSGMASAVTITNATSQDIGTCGFDDDSDAPKIHRGYMIWIKPGRSATYDGALCKFFVRQGKKTLDIQNLDSTGIKCNFKAEAEIIIFQNEKNGSLGYRLPTDDV